jgi:hypothetical protein
MKNKTIVIVCLAAVCLDFSAMAKVPQYAPTDGLIGWWPFNGNALDESKNQNHGNVIQASLTQDRFGFSNRAYSFNGQDSYISVLSNESLTPRSSFSISLWCYIDATITESFIRILNKGINQSPSWSSYAIITGNGGLNQGGDVGVTVQTNQIYSWTGVTGISHLNEWVHIVGTYDGKNLKCYKNSVLVSTQSATGEIQYSQSNLEFGRETDANGNPGTGDYFKGNIDDVGIWNRALSQIEVNALYDAIDSGPRTATATPQLFNGFVVGSTITDGGNGYVEAPSITFTGGGGKGASATATIEGGIVTRIAIQNPGSGYTSPPVMTISPPPFPPRQATGIAQVLNGFLVEVAVLDGGFGYTAPPEILLIGGGGEGATASAEITDGVITRINITNPGRRYTSAPSLQIAPPPFEPKIDIEVSRVNVNLTLVVGARYQIESSTDALVWTPTGPSFIADEANLVAEFVVETSGRLFRIRQIP